MILYFWGCTVKQHFTLTVAAPSEHFSQYFKPPSFTWMRLFHFPASSLKNLAFFTQDIFIDFRRIGSSCPTQVPKSVCTAISCKRKKYLVSGGAEEEGRMADTQGWPRGVCASPGMQHISSSYSRQMKSLGSTETWIQMCQPECVKTAA